MPTILARMGAPAWAAVTALEAAIRATTTRAAAIWAAAIRAAAIWAATIRAAAIWALTAAVLLAATGAQASVEELKATYFSQARVQRICDYSHCQQIRPVDLCFFMQDLPHVPFDLISPKQIARPNCSPSSKVVHVQRASDINKTFTQLAPQCQQVRQMVIFGHGSPGRMYHTPDQILTPEYFKPFQCTAAPGVSVLLSGCNVGRGCLGALYLRRWQRAFFPNVGAAVAPRHWAVAFVPGVVPSASTSWLKLNYTQGHEKWSIESPKLFSTYRPSLLYQNPGAQPGKLSTTATMDPIENQCRNELAERIQLYHRVYNLHKKLNCPQIESLRLHEGYLRRLNFISQSSSFFYEDTLQKALHVLRSVTRKIRLHCLPKVEYKGYVGAF